MSMTVIFIRMAPALAAEIRATPDAALFTALIDGKTKRAGFDPDADMWSDADWRDFDAYTASDPAHPLNELLSGPIFHGPVNYYQGEPAWIEPSRVAALFRELAAQSGFDPGLTGAEPSDFEGALIAFDGLVPFLRHAVQRGDGLITGID